MKTTFVPGRKESGQNIVSVIVYAWENEIPGIFGISTRDLELEGTFNSVDK